MSTINWILINPQLIPPFLLAAIGALLIMLSAIFYQVRTKQFIVFFSIRRIAEDFSKLEQRMIIIAVILGVLSFIGLVVVSEVIGYKTL